ncbi:MAG: hypothetical protein GEU99_02470 [Luteitalea sp.]|nr:hypothetical protein [Luteitalea sp.]
MNPRVLWKAINRNVLAILILMLAAVVAGQVSADGVSPGTIGNGLDADTAHMPSLTFDAPWQGVNDDASFRSMAARSGVSGQGLRDLEAARRATAPFHSIDVAAAAGWPDDVTGCLDFPDGYMGHPPGAMGSHYRNLGLVTDGGALDPTRPELVLYERQADGSLRLLGVEYIIRESDRPRTDPPPVLFGREIHFHPDFGVWGLHVWLWRHNPYGLFADVNPKVSCEHAELGSGG